MSSNASEFTPSDLVILFGDRFAPEAGILMPREEVLTSGKKIGNEGLALAAVRAALLANEQAGAIRLEKGTKKVMFGLMKKETMNVVVTGSPPAWPQGSMEAAVAAAAARGTPNVEELVAALIVKQRTDPSKHLLDIARIGMALRGLLAAEETKKLKILTTIKYTLPDPVRARLNPADADEVKSILDSDDRTRPDISRAVTKAIKSAIAAMTESSE
jgi:hypothetical protein